MMKHEYEKALSGVGSTAKLGCLRIEYVSWGGHYADSAMRWQAVEPTGEVFEYGSLHHLRYVCRENRRPYEVIKHHRNGTESIVERWPLTPNAKVRRAP